jgi:hypothetical protein
MISPETGPARIKSGKGLSIASPAPERNENTGAIMTPPMARGGVAAAAPGLGIGQRIPSPVVAGRKVLGCRPRG